MAQLVDNKFISREKFRQYVQQQLMPEFAAVEIERKRRIKHWSINGFIIESVILGLIWISYETFFMFLFGILLWCALVVPMLTVLCIFVLYPYENKKKYVPKMFNELGLKTKQDVITRMFVRKSLLLDSLDYYDFIMDDAFSGTYCGTAFSVQEAFIRWNRPFLNLSLPVTQNFNNLQSLQLGQTVNKMMPYHPQGVNNTFKGLYIAVALDKPFKKRAMVYNTISVFHKMRKGFVPVEIEDAEFMAAHQILAQDQVEVRYILTPAFIERLKEMRKAFFAWRLDVAFFDHYAFFQVHTDKNMFELFSIIRKANDINTYMKFYDEIKAICEMIRVLKIDNQKQEAALSQERREKKEQREKKRKARKMAEAISHPQNPAEKERPFNEEGGQSPDSPKADDDEEELLNTVL